MDCAVVLDEPIMPDRPEANPTYWLEIRQTRRNYLFFATLFGGVLAGVYMFLMVFDPTEDIWWDEFPLLAFPLGIYALGVLAIPSYVGVKLASQQINEDLALLTPLRSRSILWGKLQVAMTLSLCLFAPSIPGALTLAVKEKPSWMLLVTAGPICTIGMSMIALGFMAGAKTPLLRGGVIFLGFVFVLGNFPALTFLGGSCVALFSPWSGMPFWAAVYGFAIGITLLMISALFLYSLGLAMMQRNRNLVHVQTVIGVVVILLVPLPLLILLLSEPDWLALLGFFLLTALYFAPPILAVKYVRRFYEKRQTAGAPRSKKIKRTMSHKNER